MEGSPVRWRMVKPLAPAARSEGWGRRPGQSHWLSQRRPAPIYTQGKFQMGDTRLEKLKELEETLYTTMQECEPRELAAIARQYRETIRGSREQ